MKKQKVWFTLVELVVVIVILWILSTVGFVAYVDYLRWARDSSRIQQMTWIFDAFQLFSTRSLIPFPRDITQLKYGSNLIWYQGDIDPSVLEKIEYSEGWRDPKNQDYFSYMISADRKSVQLLSYFEDEKSIKSQDTWLTFNPWLQTNAAFDEDINFAGLYNIDYTILYPYVYGFELWILIEDESKAPVNKDDFLRNAELNLFTSTWTYNSYISNAEILEWSWDAFLWIIPRTDCAKIQKLLWGVPSWIYKINPSGVKPINTYCDMAIDGGWWTLVWRTHQSATQDFWWLSEYWNVFNDNEIYSMGNDVKDIRFNEVLFTTYSSSKDIDSAVKLTVDNFFDINIAVPDDTSITPVTSCEMVLTGGLVNPCLSANTWNQSAFTQWWKFALTDTFWTWFNGTFSGSLQANGYQWSTTLWSWFGDSFDWKQWMIFIR